MADTLTYDVLTADDELSIVTQQLRSVEQQHYIAYLGSLSQAADQPTPQLDALAAQVEALQAEYERVKAEVPADDSSTAAPQASTPTVTATAKN